MDFVEIFRGVLDKFPECAGIAMAGIDGIIVEFAAKDDSLDMEILAAEYASLLQAAARGSENCQTGTVDEMSVITDKNIIIMMPVAQEYFILMVVAIGANFGKGRYFLKTLVPQVQDIM